MDLTSQRRGAPYGWFLVTLVAASFAYHSAREAHALRGKLLNAQLELETLRTDTNHTDQVVAVSSPSPTKKLIWTNVHGQILTEDDRQLSLALNERRKRGEYILKFESPLGRKVMEAGIKQVAARIASNRMPALDAIFSQLGIDSEVANQLKEHQEKIALASLQTETAMQQLILARQTYDARMRSLLSADDYNRYREFEDSGAATREYAALQLFANQSNTPLEPAYEQKVIDLIRNSQAYTTESWHGPYDGWPQIALGRDMVVEKIEQEIGQISQAASTLRERATQVSLPAGYVDLLGSYFASQIAARNRTLENLNQSSGR